MRIFLILTYYDDACNFTSIFREGSDEYVWDHFEESVRMSTYLVAFVVSKYGFVTATPRPNNVQVRFWAKNASLDQTAYAQEIGPKFLEFFENYFDIPFPMPKQVLTRKEKG